ncbi:MAG: FadR/GntR family transcriptional regulator [Bacteroidota bacterium]|nr:FadR/GntR family transcriptional regulator [Bacteroidota bacterium]
MKKKLLVGSKLPSERELCEMFAVSRTALREALRRLSARGLIQIKKGSGMYVTELTIEDAINSLNLYYDLQFNSNLISQIIEARMVFEPQISKMASRNRSDNDICILKENIESLIKCNPDNTQMEVDIINKFHLNVAKATQNPFMIITMEPIYTLIPRMRNLIYANVEGEKEPTLKSQQIILQAIIDKDEDLAYRASLQLVERTNEIYDKYFRK